MSIRIKSSLSLFVACFLVVGLAVPSLAWATVEEDQSPASDAEIAASLGGEQSFLGNESNDDEPLVAPLDLQGRAVPSPVNWQPLAGPTMFETAVEEAKAAYPSGSKTAIIAGPGASWVDALASAGLSATKGPILFTEKNRLFPATKTALIDFGVKSVIVVGGTAAVSDGVVSELKAAGITLEKRLGGADCYDTQMKIYEYGLQKSLWNPGMAIIATGSWFGDALSVSPVAYAKKAPIFLADSSKNLQSVQKDALIAAARKGSMKDLVIVGGPAAVSEDTAGFADYISALAGGTGAAQRLAGATQFETSSAIAEWAVKSQGFSWNKLAISTGSLPYDALAGSVLQGVSKSVLLLASDYDSSTVSTVGKHASSISTVRFFGGEAATPMRVRMGVADALDAPHASLPGFKVYLDAGHGWNDSNNGVFDSGATGNGYQEADLTKELAGLVSNILRNEYGVSVYLNDDGGWYKARHAEAINQGCDAIVSIHFNSGGGTGSESLIHNYNASYLSRPLQNQIHPYLIQGVGLTDRGKKTQEVAILGGYLPATMLEVCFIDSSRDMGHYASSKSAIARKIAEGIVS